MCVGACCPRALPHSTAAAREAGRGRQKHAPPPPFPCPRPAAARRSLPPTPHSPGRAAGRLVGGAGQQRGHGGLRVGEGGSGAAAAAAAPEMFHRSNGGRSAQASRRRVPEPFHRSVPAGVTAACGALPPSPEGGPWRRWGPARREAGGDGRSDRVVNASRPHSSTRAREGVGRG